ncbi:MAG: hypothetical protein AB1601_16150 [Planctomycetota bacterium]
MFPDDPGRLAVPRGRRVRRWAVVSACVAVVGLAALGLGVTCRPAAYRPASVDAGRLRDDKAALAELQESISAGLNAGREVSVRLTEEQINRWLAGWAEIWPDAPWQRAGVRHPQVTLLDDAVRVGVTIDHGAWSAVVTCSARLEVCASELAVRCTGVRVGVIPVPVAWVLSGVMRSAPLEETGVRFAGDRVVRSNAWVWPNGHRRYRVSACRVTPGQIEVVLQPVGGPVR